MFDAVEPGPHPEGPGLVRVVGDLRRVQQRLGGDAAPVQARAADLVLFDERDLLAELGGPQRAGVAAAAATEDDDVIPAASVSHGTLLDSLGGASPGYAGPALQRPFRSVGRELDQGLRRRYGS